MKKLNKGSISKIILVVFLVLIYVLVVEVLALPLYYLVLAYICFFVLFAIAFQKNLIALVGNYNYALGNMANAEKFLKKAIDKNTKNSTAYLNYAIMLVKSGNAEEALNLLKKAEKFNTNVLTDKNILLTMGSCYWVLNDIDKAIEVLEALRTKYEYVNSHVLTTLGYMYFIKDDIEKAILFTQKAIDESPDLGSAWDNLGQIQLKLDDIQNAKQSFEKAIAYNKDLVDSYYYLGIIAENQDDSGLAKDYFAKARNCSISFLNTVTEVQVTEKYLKYN